MGVDEAHKMNEQLNVCKKNWTDKHTNVFFSLMQKMFRVVRRKGYIKN